MLDSKPLPSSCTGQVFRGYRSVFWSKGRLEVRQGIRHLKRKSCKCNDCAWVVDMVHDAVTDDYLILPDVIEDGEFYDIRVVNESVDWETGYVDSYDVEVFSIKEDTVDGQTRNSFSTPQAGGR